MMTILFWALLALDLAGILLFFALSLAAAGSTRDNPLFVALLTLVLPCMLLAAVAVLFVKSGSTALRIVALLLVATPPLALVLGRAVAVVQMRVAMNEEGEMTYFGAGPTREIAEAIVRNDVATVSSLANKGNVNRKGLSGMTLLGLAMRQLRETPKEQQVLRVLLEAGADPNQSAQYEYPLGVAIQMSDEAGQEPIKLLLDAGADLKQIDTFGRPVFHSVIGMNTNLETLGLLLDRGADVNAMTKQGETLLITAGMLEKWKVALFLLERGADWKVGVSVNGMPFEYMVDGYAGHPDEDGSRAAVKRYLQEHPR